MNDIARKVTERLYGNDKVKCKFIHHLLIDIKKTCDVLGSKDCVEFVKACPKAI